MHRKRQRLNSEQQLIVSYAFFRQSESAAEKKLKTMKLNLIEIEREKKEQETNCKQAI